MMNNWVVCKTIVLRMNRESDFSGFLNTENLFSTYLVTSNSQSETTVLVRLGSSCSKGEKALFKETGSAPVFLNQ